MDLEASVTDFELSKNHSPSARRWYLGRLGTFIDWLRKEGVTAIEAVTASHARRCIEYRRTAPTRTGSPLSSATLNGHARAIRAWLNWAGYEGLADEAIARRIKPPKVERRLMPVLTPAQVERMLNTATSPALL